MKKLLFLLFLLAAGSSAFAQTGELQGKITDEKTGKIVELANIAAYENGVLKTGAQADFDGFYSIKPIKPGKYDIEVSYIGYGTQRIEGVLVNTDKITFLDVKIKPLGGINIDVVTISVYKVPLLEQDKTSSGGTVTKEEIGRMATRNVNSIASTSASVYQKDEGGGLNIRGQRSNGTDYYIDGIKVSGGANIPASAIEQLTVITGGLPARYGDATGGIVAITLRGAAAKYYGGVEAVTSQFIDAYGHNFITGNLSGPLLFKGKKGDANRRPLVGFFAAAEYQRDLDPNPTANDMYTLSDSKLEEMRKNPLAFSPTGTGFIKSYDLLTRADMVKIKARPNMQQTQIRGVGRLDFSLNKNFDLSFGASYDLDKNRDFADSYLLFNSENNSQNVDKNIRVYGKFTQRFNKDTSRTALFNNAYYTIQADFTRATATDQSIALKDDIFQYGYVGKFKTENRKIYNYGTDRVSGASGYLLTGYFPVVTGYEAGTSNPSLSAVTTQLYSLLSDEFQAPVDEIDFFGGINQIESLGGMINGTRTTSAQSAYSLWHISGRRPNLYRTTMNDQYRLTANGSVDFKPRGASERNKHSIELGFEYEQRVERLHAVNASTLWTLMRQLSNEHLTILDTTPILMRDAFGVYQDTINYDLRYDGVNHRQFDKSLRQKLGMNVTGLDFIDVDNVDPNILSLDMFSADDLFNTGNSYISYYGYNHDGSINRSNPSFKDFFKKKDNKGNFERPIGAYAPIYTAAYIQDKFAFKDLIFNIGLRVDRFDANQKVLRDKYSLYGVRRASEVDNLGSHPTTIGDDYVVYVDDIDNPTQITAYRNGDDWYDAAGNFVKDPSIIAAGYNDRLNPYLSDNSVTKTENNTSVKGANYDVDAAFEDFKPQVSLNPRVAFSFPIASNEEGSGAMFFAHFDVLTQRPQGRNIATADDIYFFPDRQDNTLNNANLKPEKTIEYQLGYKQKIGSNSALTLSMFYRELRNLVQQVGLKYAYPRRYVTYGNVDFGTVKGLEVSYDMRRVSNIQLRANYTLQFADGTGSDDASQENLVDAGVPNLKVIAPLNIDSRHNITLTLDYRYGSGDDYTGPKFRGKSILQNAGANFIVRARSGEPFTRKGNPIGTQLIGDAGKTFTAGSINGSRLPWNFRIDLKLDKDIKLGKKENANFLNAYVLIQNVLNTKNVIEVYNFTGNPTDDGYLSAPENQGNIEDQVSEESFRDLYSIKMNKTNVYSLPRRIRLGLSYNF
jgi:hypothetical protein